MAFLGETVFATGFTEGDDDEPFLRRTTSSSTMAGSFEYTSVRPWSSATMDSNKKQKRIAFIVSWSSFESVLLPDEINNAVVLNRLRMGKIVTKPWSQQTHQFSQIEMDIGLGMKERDKEEASHETTTRWGGKPL